MNRELLKDNAVLMEQYDYDKNSGIDLETITTGSNKKVWWRCDKGHEWMATIASRNAGHGCPYCSGRNALVGFNDLKTKYPSVAKEWNYARNHKTPEDYSPGSNKKVWWICSKGHEWQAVINNRCHQNQGCPYCSGNRTINGENDFATVHPELLVEWDYEKNHALNINPNELSSGSGKNVWWKCSLGHSWEATVTSRTHGDGCPYCSGHRVLCGFNDLLSLRPDIAKEWNYEKNKDLTPNKVTEFSSKRVWWKCDRGHEWRTNIYQRVKGTTCPYCSNKKTLKGFNDFPSIHPELLSEWNYTKNDDITPYDYTSGSHKKVWWRCKSCGNEWQATIQTRCNGSACPKCGIEKSKSTRKNNLLNGEINTLEVKRPDLLAEWDYDKNTVSPREVTCGSKIKVWWKCSACGSNYEKAICDKNRGIGCPYCSGLLPIAGKTDLATLYPELLIEWDYEKNDPIGITPENVTKSSGKKAWWLCRNCGNRWKAVISSRTRGIGCPICASVRHSSLAEQIVYYYVCQAFPDAINSYRPDYLDGKEYDIYIPSIKLGIEYDGVAWHKNASRDDKKNELAEANNDKIIRIREPNCKRLIPSSNVTIIETEKPKDDYLYLEVALKKMFCIMVCNYELKVIPSIDVNRDYFIIASAYEKAHKQKSLEAVNPSLAAEWNYDKNKGLTPDKVTEFSGKKVWWRCDKGHEWQAKIADRSMQHGCPYCMGKRVLKGFNDLITLYPNLVNEYWDYDKNHEIADPSNCGKGSNKKVWWKCNKGHEWQATIASFVKTGRCPYCAGFKVLPGMNDITVTNPEVIKEWDYEKNEELGLFPYNFSKGSKQVVWWKCAKGHEWQASIKSKTSGHGCAFCANQKVLSGFNDLATTYPRLLEEWDYENNSSITPDAIFAGTKKKVWWKCKNGHSYLMAPQDKKRGNGCPICAKSKTRK